MLKKNQLLEAISREIPLRQPNWDKIVDRFRKTALYSKKKYDDSNLPGKLAEIHLRLSLEKITEPYQDRIKFDPIKSGSQSENYSFIQYDDRLVVKSKDSLKEYSEIDQLLVVDSLPSLFEIKLAKYRSKGRHNGLYSHRGRSIGISDAMSNDRINYITQPITEYFDKDECGYTLVVSNYQILKNSSLQQDFLKKNGLLVPFYTNREKFSEEVLEIKSLYDL